MFTLKCLDGCGRISGRFLTRLDAELRWTKHIAHPVQALHRCVILGSVPRDPSCLLTEEGCVLKVEAEPCVLGDRCALASSDAVRAGFD